MALFFTPYACLGCKKRFCKCLLSAVFVCKLLPANWLLNICFAHLQFYIWLPSKLEFLTSQVWVALLVVIYPPRDWVVESIVGDKEEKERWRLTNEAVLVRSIVSQSLFYSPRGKSLLTEANWLFLIWVKGNIPVPTASVAQGRLGAEGGFLGWLCQTEAQLCECCDPPEVTGRAGDMLVVSSLTPPGQHGASAPLCFSLMLPTHALEVAVADERGTIESSNDSCSGPEEQAICFPGGLQSWLPAGYCVSYGVVKVAGLDWSNAHEDADHQTVCWELSPLLRGHVALKTVAYL